MKKKNYKLDKEEQEILDSVEKGEWVSTDNFQEQKEYFQQVARNTLKKNQRVNLRLTKFDLDGIRARAVREGIPYQTLMASIIHKYVTGQLVEKRD